MFFEERVFTMRPGLFRVWKLANKKKLERLVGECGTYELALEQFETQVKKGRYVYLTATHEGRTRFVLNAVSERRSRIDHRSAVRRLLT